MAKTMKIRPANSEDTADIATIGPRAGVMQFGSLKEPMPQEEAEVYVNSCWTSAIVSAYMQNTEKKMSVACDNAGRVIGFVQICLTNQCPYHKEDTTIWSRLNMLYVDPDAKRQGFRGQLLQETRKAVNDAGYERIWLMVMDERSICTPTMGFLWREDQNSTAECFKIVQPASVSMQCMVWSGRSASTKDRLVALFDENGESVEIMTIMDKFSSVQGRFR